MVDGSKSMFNIFWHIPEKIDSHIQDAPLCKLVLSNNKPLKPSTHRQMMLVIKFDKTR